MKRDNSTATTKRRRNSRRRQLQVEQLETRALLSTLGQIGGAAGSAWTWGPQGMDAQGNVYLSGGRTGTVDFDPGIGVVELTDGSGYVAKYNPQGGLIWVRQVPNGVSINGLTVDPSGTPYVFGGFQGTVDFGGIGNTLVSAGAGDPLVLKMESATGNTIWARTGGGSLREENVWDASVGADGSVFSTGTFSQQVDFDRSRSYSDNRDILTATGWDTSRKNRDNTTADVFVWKLNSAGDFVSAFNVGGKTSERGEEINVDVDVYGNGSVYLSGAYSGTADFDPGPLQTNRTSAGSLDVFNARYAVTGTSVTLNWVNSIGSSGTELSYRMNTDSQYVYLAGGFSNVVDFDPSSGTRNLTPNGYDLAIAKYRKTDGGLEWVGRVGGSSEPSVNSLMIVDEAAGMIYVGGQFQLTMTYVNPLGNSSISQSSVGLQDGYVLKLNSIGAYQSAWRMGGSGNDSAKIVGVSGGAAYISGTFQNTADFPYGGSLTDLGGGGIGDAFLLALDQPAPLLAATVPTKSIDQSLTVSQYQPIVAEAQRRWEATGVDTSALSGVKVQVRNLGGTTLGLASGNTIWLDDNAAGWGWFVDATPTSNSEFFRAGNQGEQQRMDLLTVVMHELGHLLGQDHDVEGVMAETLVAGIRRTDTEHDNLALVDQVFGQPVDHQTEGLLGTLLDDRLNSRGLWFKRRR